MRLPEALEIVQADGGQHGRCSRISVATELFVVFVGLVGALQVDQWRERRELAGTETVYLQRLSEDLNGYIAFLKLVMPQLEEHRRAVAHVNQPSVQYYSDGERVTSTDFAGGTEGNRIRYDFDELRSQLVIRNGYCWAQDTHGDWVEWSNKLLGLAVAADAIAATQLKGRQDEPGQPSNERSHRVRPINSHESAATARGL